MRVEISVNLCCIARESIASQRGGKESVERPFPSFKPFKLSLSDKSDKDVFLPQNGDQIGRVTRMIVVVAMTEPTVHCLHFLLLWY